MCWVICNKVLATMLIGLGDSHSRPLEEQVLIYTLGGTLSLWGNLAGWCSLVGELGKLPVSLCIQDRGEFHLNTISFLFLSLSLFLCYSVSVLLSVNVCKFYNCFLCLFCIVCISWYLYCQHLYCSYHNSVSASVFSP